MALRSFTPKYASPGNWSSDATREAACKALDHICAARPLKPPRSRPVERSATAGAIEAAKARRRAASDPVLSPLFRT